MNNIHRRLQDPAAPSASSNHIAGRMKRQAPSHRPQHERQTLAPRRQPSPTRHSHNGDIPTCLHVGTDGQDIKTMRGTPTHSTVATTEPLRQTLPPRSSSPPRRGHQDNERDPRPTQQWQTREPLRPTLPPRPSSPPRRGDRPLLQAMTDRTSSSTRRPAPTLLRTPPVQRDGIFPMENQRKRERRRRNGHLLYKELEDLVLRHTQVRL